MATVTISINFPPEKTIAVNLDLQSSSIIYDYFYFATFISSCNFHSLTSLRSFELTSTSCEKSITFNDKQPGNNKTLIVMGKVHNGNDAFKRERKVSEKFYLFATEILENFLMNFHNLIV